MIKNLHIRIQGIKRLFVSISGVKNLYVSFVAPPVQDGVFDKTFDNTFQ